MFENVREITMQLLLQVLWRRWYLVVSGLVLGVTGSQIFLLVAQPRYKVSISIMAWNDQIREAVEATEKSTGAPPREGAPDAAIRNQMLRNTIISQSIALSYQLIGDYENIINSSRIQNMVRRKLEKLFPAPRYQVTAHKKKRVNSCLIQLESTSTDPEIAAVAAEETFQAFLVTQKELMRFGMAEKMDEIVIPETPFFPNRLRTFGIGILLGLLLGYGVALALEYFTFTVKSVDNLEMLGIRLLGAVPFYARIRECYSGASNARNAVMVREAFRSIRSTLGFLAIDQPPQLLYISSLTPGAGKSTCSLLLGQAMCINENSTLVIDCDLRLGSIAEKLNIAAYPGLVEVLIGSEPLEKCIQHSPWKYLDILPRGTVPPDPGELLASQKLKDLIEQLRTRYRYIILDAPPILGFSDVLFLNHIADGSIWVMNYNRTRLDALGRTCKLYPQLREKLLGAIINRDKLRTSHYGYHIAKYYDE